MNRRFQGMHAKGLQSLQTLYARMTENVVSGPKYRTLLTDRGLTHAQAAEKMGVSVRTSERWTVDGAPRDAVEKL